MLYSISCPACRGLAIEFDFNFTGAHTAYCAKGHYWTLRKLGRRVQARKIVGVQGTTAAASTRKGRISHQLSRWVNYLTGK